MLISVDDADVDRRGEEEGLVEVGRVPTNCTTHSPLITPTPDSLTQHQQYKQTSNTH